MPVAAGHHHEPRQGLLPEMGYTKLDLVRYYVSVAEGALRGVMRRPMVLKRFVNGADDEPFFQKRAPANLPDGIETAHRHLPQRPLRRPRRLRRRRRPRLGHQPRLHRPQPLARSRRRRRPPGRAAHRPRPHARSHLRRTSSRSRCRQRGAGRAAATAASPRRQARAASTSTSASSHSADFTDMRRCGPRPRPRSGAPHPRARHHGVVEGRAPRRLHRLQPERPRPHRRLGLLRAPDAGRPRLRPARVGRAARRRAGRLHDRTVPERFARHGDPGAAIDDLASRSSRCSSSSRSRKRDGLGDAPWPPQFPKAAGEPRRVMPSKRRKE